jgi:hypothetical protein
MIRNLEIKKKRRRSQNPLSPRPFGPSDPHHPAHASPLSLPSGLGMSAPPLSPGAHPYLSACGPRLSVVLRPWLASRPRSPTGGPRLSAARPLSRLEPFPRATHSPTCQPLSLPHVAHSPWPSLGSITPSPLLPLRAMAPANHPA